MLKCFVIVVIIQRRNTSTSTSNRNRGLSIFKACLLVYFVFCVWISHLDFQNIPNIWLYRSDSASRSDITGFQLDSNLDHFHFEQIDVLTTFRRGIPIPTKTRISCQSTLDFPSMHFSARKYLQLEF